ncbi:MAG: addiction module toxin, HicA family [Deltaproteobacteria bacterium]|nr:addiction module toxin, HicA family [Deltaproteobacteria bacterium]
MGSIPVLRPKEIVSILKKFGFYEVRQRGSHKQFTRSSNFASTLLFQQLSF